MELGLRCDTSHITRPGEAMKSPHSPGFLFAAQLSLTTSNRSIYQKQHNRPRKRARLRRVSGVAGESPAQQLRDGGVHGWYLLAHQAGGCSAG